MSLGSPSQRSLLSASAGSMELLPNLPGFRRESAIRPATSPKKQSLFTKNGVSFLREELPSIQQSLQEESTTMVLGSRVSTARPRTMTKVARPSGLILTFHAYFEELALHTRLEEVRIRRCTIFYYEEDEGIMIVERAQLNSGMKQGTILRRTCVNKPDGTTYQPQDFRIGNSLEILGTVYNIIDCDMATRNYLGEESAPLPVPLDAFEESRRVLHFKKDGWGAHHSKKNMLKTFHEAKLGNTVNNSGRDGFQKFGKVALRFSCLWDDTSSLYGDVIEYNLVYHVSDDTVEVYSKAPSNSGREQFPRLLKRAKLPLNFGELNLNDYLATVYEKQQYYHWSDIRIGSQIMVYSRHLFVVDADLATRDFYMQQGYELGPSQRPESMPPPFLTREIPPPTGYGSDEDSLQSVTGPLSMNGTLRRKKMGENKVLAFVAELISATPEDATRKFVITFYVSDQTIKVTEISVKNSGFIGGPFLARSKLKTPTGEFIVEKHMFVGAIVELQRHQFRLVEANEHTLKFMEAHRDDLYMSNIFVIMDKLRCVTPLWSDANNGTLANTFINADKLSKGQAAIGTLRKVLGGYGLLGATEFQICEHEIITIVRAFGNLSLEFCDYRKFISELIEPTEQDM